MSSEEWRSIAECPDYEVSNLGRVRRATDALRRGHVMVPKGRILRPMTHSHGYHFVNLTTEGCRKTFLVHRLVCIAFHGEPPTSHHEVAHWDGDRTSNRAGNLRWATSAENSSDLIRHGRSNRGSRHGNAKLTEPQVREIRHLIATGAAQSLIASKFSVSRGRIASIKTGRDWAWLT